MRLTDEQQLRFWSKVKSDNSGCWIWTGAVTNKGYGEIVFNKRNHSAHKIAWMLVNGRMPKKGMCIMHSCDNRRCVNPRHLSEGTHAENMLDMKRKDRSGRKLTLEQVKEIRQSGGTNAELARVYNVSSQAISQLRRGKTWNLGNS